DFAKFIKSKLSGKDFDKKEDIFVELENQSFLPKLKTTENSVVPYQLHKSELDIILENAAKHYGFLNDVDETKLSVKQKLQQIFTFRIPYYIGPLNPAHQSKESRQCWIIKKQGIPITPWNFNDVVNIHETAEKFIVRMTNKCSYLPQEDVLPKNSLLYSEFIVLNEINNLKVDNQDISTDLKQKIIDEEFKTKTKVTPKRIVECLKRNNSAYASITINNISGIDVEGGIKSSLRSFLDFKLFIESKKLSENDVEEIIRIITIFGDDKNILKKRILQIKPDLSNDDVKKIMSKKYAGWGRLSKKLLTGITARLDSNSEEYLSIISALRKTNYNFMELLADQFDYKNHIDKLNTIGDSSKKIEYVLVKNCYASPAVKRQLWQSLLIVKELKKVLKKEPKKIFIEVAREEGEKQRTVSRKNKLIELYKNCRDIERNWVRELENLSDEDLRKDNLYFYYMQMGKCMYSQAPIAIEDLYSKNIYDQDHIYPRSISNDDSLNNRVLVKKDLNSHKSDTYPLEQGVREKQLSFWTLLLERGFITKEKYKRLTRHVELTQEELASFINRQLVETRQSTKLMADILKKIFPTTEIVYSKAGNVSFFRQKFDLLKCRSVNDFHHAHDAYLNIVVGNIYSTKFTKSPINFIKNAEKRSYNLYKIFDFDVNGAWSIDKNATEQSINQIKKIFAKNDVLVTRLAVEQKGVFFDQTLMKKGKGQFPIKTSEQRLQNINQYGGYNKINGAYFILVEHDKRKKRITTFEPVFIYAKEQCKTKESLLSYCKEKLGLVNPCIKIAKVKMGAMICIDGFKASVTARQGSQIVIKNENQLIVSKELQDHIRAIEKFIARKKKNPQAQLTPFDAITAEKNLALYDELIRKLESSIYKIKIGAQSDVLKNLRNNFIEKEVSVQASVLNEILYLFQCNRVSTNIKDINGGSQIGSLSISKNIENSKNLVLINQSITGIFESRIKLT
ncbi:MAG: type II CRISPR RNA-guided endonuclease Cas9, partial [Treponemataceae bacterium]